ncbi:MAG: hypothetical protein ACFB4I_12990 [Cyanophyceae cyanobacterium]
MKKISNALSKFKQLRLTKYQLWLCAALVACVYLLINHATAFTYLGVPLALGILMWKDLWRQTAKAVGPGGKYIPEIVAAVAAIALIWGVGIAEPVGAQFYQDAQNFFCEELVAGTGSDTENVKRGISVTFNALRAFFLIYIAVSLIRVVNAVREDEDWQTMARTPILATLIVTVGDLLTNFFISGDPSDGACDTGGSGG